MGWAAVASPARSPSSVLMSSVEFFIEWDHLSRQFKLCFRGTHIAISCKKC